MAEKKQLPPFKEFMEQMYGVKINDPTPEERAYIRKWLKETCQRGQEKQNQQTGPEDTPSSNR